MLQTTKLFVLALALAGSSFLNPAQAQMPKKQLELKAAQAAAAQAAATKGQTSDTSRGKPANQQAPQTVKKAVQKPSQEQNSKAPKAGSNIAFPSSSTQQPQSNPPPEIVAPKDLSLPNNNPKVQSAIPPARNIIRDTKAFQVNPKKSMNDMLTSGALDDVKTKAAANLSSCMPLLLESGMWQRYLDALKTWEQTGARTVGSNRSGVSLAAPSAPSCDDVNNAEYQLPRAPSISHWVNQTTQPAFPLGAYYWADNLTKIEINLNVAFDRTGQWPGIGYSDGVMRRGIAEPWIDDHVTVAYDKNCTGAFQEIQINPSQTKLKLSFVNGINAPTKICIKATRVGGTARKGIIARPDLRLEATHTIDLTHLRDNVRTPKDKLTVIAFGDSYGSGEGNPAVPGSYPSASLQFTDNVSAQASILQMQNQIWWNSANFADANAATNDPINLNSTNYCHRSSESGVGQLFRDFLNDANELGIPKANMNLASFACTGAVSKNLYLESQQQEGVVGRRSINNEQGGALWKQIRYPNGKIGDWDTKTRVKIYAINTITDENGVRSNAISDSNYNDIINMATNLYGDAKYLNCTPGTKLSLSGQIVVADSTTCTVTRTHKQLIDYCKDKPINAAYRDSLFSCSDYMDGLPPQILQANAWLERNGIQKDDVDIVIVSIGGNDAKFGYFIEECILMPGTCYNDDDFITEKNKASNRVKAAIYFAAGQLYSSYPNAKIIFSDYPQAMTGRHPWADETVACDPDRFREFQESHFPDDPNWDIDGYDVEFLNELNKAISGAVRDTARDVNVRPPSDTEPQLSRPRPGSSERLAFTNMWDATERMGFCDSRSVVMFNDEAVRKQGQDRRTSAFGLDLNLPYSSGGWHPNARGYYTYKNEFERVILEKGWMHGIFWGDRSDNFSVEVVDE